MGSSRFILGLLGIIFLVIVLLSSSKLLETLRNKTGIQNQKGQVSDAQISITPTPGSEAVAENDQNVTAGTEIPSTGPTELSYLLLGSGIILGKFLRKIKG